MVAVLPLGPLAAQAAEADWSARGVRVRFPREFAPDRVVRDTVVADRFSGYEWRVVLESPAGVRLVAFVVPPDPQSLRLPVWRTNEEAVAAGRSQVRLCEAGSHTLRCGRPANALVRVVAGQLELVISESRWFLAVTAMAPPRLHLAVRRGGDELWSAILPIPAEAQ